MGGTYEAIFRELSKMPVIDTHEHLPFSEEDRNLNTDVLREYLSHYLSSDIISSGMKRADFDKVMDPELSITERWNLVEPYWEACRYTGYGRALDISVRAVYGVDGVNGRTIETLDAAFKKALSPGHLHFVLKELCGIELSILDGFSGYLECDKTLFRRVWQPSNYIFPMAGVVHWLEDRFRLTIKTLDDWMAAFDTELEDALAKDAVALKIALAYMRTLKYEKVDYITARRSFAKTFDRWEKAGRGSDIDFSFDKDVQDYMMHHILGRANAKGLTVQFHTGLQEGNGNTISNSDPSLLNNLFLEYPDMNFDLFHIGYPYYGVTSALCKNFPNVTIDMCWAHIISPQASRSALSDFLDAVPYNKISAFGGDYLFVDGVYGHLRMARENVSRVLADKVAEGVFSLDVAVKIGRALFYDNPMRIFKLA
jgi:hypothetical protein